MMMLSGRPLLATAADRRYLVERDEIDVVLGYVRAGMNVLVLAERGMGRTTFLRHLEWLLEDETSLDENEPSVDAIYMDGHRLSNAAMILLAVRHRLTGSRNPAAEHVRAMATSLIPNPIEARNEEALGLVRELTREGKKRKICVLLDDPDPQIAHQLFGQLRDELWQTGIVWVVAGDPARRQQYLTPPADAFFERVVELAPLADDQQHDLIRRRMSSHDRRDRKTLLNVRAQSGNPRALLTALRDAASSPDNAQGMIARRAERQQRAHEQLGRLEEMMLAEIENGAAASASDPGWTGRFGISRQRAQQALAALEREQLVRAERLPGPSGRPRKVYRRLEAV